jgi:hypothetical protein
MVRGAMMGFRAASAAALSGGLLVATAVSAAAQQAATPPAATVRFPLGVQFEIPQGWSVRDQKFGPGSNSVVVSHDADGPWWGKSVRNRNELTVVFNGGIPEPASEQALKAWTRVDADRSQVLPNGALVRWKVGRMWNVHEALGGSATLGSTTLGFMKTDAPARHFDPAVLEGALLKIAGSMRAMPPGQALFHPALQMALDWHDPKRWPAEITEYDFRLRCEICGRGSRTHMVIAPMITVVPYDNLDAALAMVTRAHVRAHKLDLSEVRHHAIADVAIAWTEQPGSRHPFVGAVRRGTAYFFVSIAAPEGMTAGNDDLRDDFLTMASSVRAWEGLGTGLPPPISRSEISPGGVPILPSDLHRR